MAFLRAARRIDAPGAVVWSLVCDFEGSPAWMLDAVSVERTSPRREGQGVGIVALTRIAGMTISDPMEVTRWEPERLIEMRHLGRVIRGIGWFEISGVAGSTERACDMEWAEEIDPPLGPLGEVGAVILRPFLERTMSRSLAALAALAAAQVGAEREDGAHPGHHDGMTNP